MCGGCVFTQYGELQISEVDHWARTPILADIGTFAVPLLMYVLIETHKKGVQSTRSDKDAMLWIGYI